MRQWTVHYQCERCGHRTPARTPFSAWVRWRPELQHHYAVSDVDWLFHRYSTSDPVQYLMMVEVKTHGAPLTAAQQNIYGYLLQLLPPPQRVKAYSTAQSREVILDWRGLHLVQLATDQPGVGALWFDGVPIDEETLARILAFDAPPPSSSLPGPFTVGGAARPI